MSRARVWEGVVMVMKGWRGRCSGVGLGSDSGLEMKSFYGKSGFWHYTHGCHVTCIYTYPAPQTEVLPNTGTHEWRAWERHSNQEFSPKVGPPLVLYTVYTCTGGNRRPLPYLGRLRPAKQHGEESLIVFIVITDSHRRWYLLKLAIYYLTELLRWDYQQGVSCSKSHERLLLWAHIHHKTAICHIRLSPWLLSHD